METKRELKYIKLYETFEDKIILYRGDSQKIDSFKDEFYDYDALLGAGLYLTDDYNKAKSYTTKGDSESVLSDLEFDDLEYSRGEVVKIPNPLQYAYNLFVQDYYCKNTNYARVIGAYTLEEVNKINLIDFVGGYSIQPKTYDINSFYSFIEDEAEINKRIAKDKIEYAEFKKFIENEYIPAYNKFDKEKDKYEFLLKSHHGLTHRYHVIDVSKSKGHVSKFEINSNLLDKFINVSNDISKIDSDVIKVFKSVLLLISGKFYKEHPYMKMKKGAWNYVSTYEYNDMLFIDYFRGVKALFRTEDKYLKLFYDKLKNELKKLGYIGFKYNGGHLTGTDEHNAYVIWNLSDVNRIE